MSTHIFHRVASDTGSPLGFELVGTDITGWLIELRAKYRDTFKTLAIQHVADDPANGLGHFDFAIGDLVKGFADFEIHFLPPSGKDFTIPNENTLLLKVRNRGEPGPGVIQAAPEQATFTGTGTDKVIKIFGGGGGGGTTPPQFDRVGWIRIVDVTAQSGNPVSSQVYQDPPGNTILQSVTVPEDTIRVLLEASYPLVDVNGTPGTLPLVGSVYRGTVDLTVAASGDVVATVITGDDNESAQDTVAVSIDAPPTITAAIFTGGYPGSQTELKAGDQFQLQITADKSFDQVVVDDFGAAQPATIGVAAGVGPTTVTIDIADRGTVPQLLGARIRVRDAVTLALSDPFDTDSAGVVDGTNVLNLNNLFPSVSVGAVAYPGGQQALKGAEVATVVNTASDFDSITYDDNGTGELTLTSPATFENPKTATRLGGSYNVTAPNFRVTANRAANDATTVDTGIVQIANVAAAVTVSEPAARLRSGGNDGTAAQDHTITIAADQQLLSAPSLDPAVGRGTFQGGGFVGGPSTWTRDLRVTDNENPGDGSANTWINLLATNLAGIVTSSISGDDTYVIGGFVPRTLVVPAFASTVAFNVPVTDFSKLTAGNFSPGGPSVKMPIGTVADTVNGYTIDAIGINPTDLELLDQAAIAANSLGLYNLANLEETV